MFSLNDKHIIVNYHYVRDPSPDWGGIHPCLISEFERQVKFLSENYKIVSVPEIFEIVKRDSSLRAQNDSGAAKRDPSRSAQDDIRKTAERFCSITFDDGLKDQYENAVPILQKYGATATFFIITSTLSGHLPSAHKIHVLLSKISIDKLIDKFDEFFKGKYVIPRDKRLTQKRLHEPIPAANFKETIIGLPAKDKEDFLAWIYGDFGLDSEKICRELFMNDMEIKALDRGGFFMESHTHNHYSLETQEADFWRKDFADSKAEILKILGREPRVMSYPHGRYNDTSLGVLKEAGFTHGVTIETRPLSPNDDPFLIPRYDTNHLKDYLNQKSNIKNQNDKA